MYPEYHTKMYANPLSHSYIFVWYLKCILDKDLPFSLNIFSEIWLVNSQLVKNQYIVELWLATENYTCPLRVCKTDFSKCLIFSKNQNIFVTRYKIPMCISFQYKEIQKLEYWNYKYPWPFSPLLYMLVFHDIHCSSTHPLPPPVLLPPPPNQSYSNVFYLK